MHGGRRRRWRCCRGDVCPLVGVDHSGPLDVGLAPVKGIAGAPGAPRAFPNSSVGKESACNAGDPSLIPELGRSSGEGKGYPLQDSGLENSVDCIVHGVTNSWTQLSDFHFHCALQGGCWLGALGTRSQHWPRVCAWWSVYFLPGTG